jgi:hypothetical protein
MLPEKFCGTRRQAGIRDRSRVTRRRLVFGIPQPVLRRASPHEILSEDDPRKTGKAAKWNRPRVVEQETPARTANSLAFDA